MRSFLSRIKGTMGDAAQVFMANNTPTCEEGGYAVFFPVWNFGGDYNRLTRPWYQGAKAKPGAVNYTDPYLAMAAGAGQINAAACPAVRIRSRKSGGAGVYLVPVHNVDTLWTDTT